MNFIASSLRGAWSPLRRTLRRGKDCVLPKAGEGRDLPPQTGAGAHARLIEAHPSVHDHPIPALWAHIKPTEVRIDEPSWFMLSRRASVKANVLRPNMLQPGIEICARVPGVCDARGAGEMTGQRFTFHARHGVCT